MRPYRIAAELDSIFDKSHLSGIGRLEFLGASKLLISDEYAGICLMYNAIHGEEDKKDMINPLDNEKFLTEFNEMFNMEYSLHKTDDAYFMPEFDIDMGNAPYVIPALIDLRDNCYLHKYID